MLEKENKEFKHGDIVIITKGFFKGKYGRIIENNDNFEKKYTIETNTFNTLFRNWPLYIEATKNELKLK